MIRDFRHILALLKAVNEIEELEKYIEGYLKDIKVSKISYSTLQMILDSTDRVFLPMMLNRELAAKIVEVELTNNKEAMKGIAKSIDMTILDMSKSSIVIENKEEAVRKAYVVCLLDDILGWYKTRKWEGPMYHVNILEAKYKARLLYLNDKDRNKDMIKSILGTLPKSDIEHESEVFYSKNWG